MFPRRMSERNKNAANTSKQWCQHMIPHNPDKMLVSFKEREPTRSHYSRNEIYNHPNPSFRPLYDFRFRCLCVRHHLLMRCEPQTFAQSAVITRIIDGKWTYKIAPRFSGTTHTHTHTHTHTPTHTHTHTHTLTNKLKHTHTHAHTPTNTHK
jgi:hypothetical protein